MTQILPPTYDKNNSSLDPRWARSRVIANSIARPMLWAGIALLGLTKLQVLGWICIGIWYVASAGWNLCYYIKTKSYDQLTRLAISTVILAIIVFGWVDLIHPGGQ